MEFVALPYGLTTAGLVEILLSFLIGLLIGMIARKLLTLALLLLALFVLLYAVGYVHPSSLQYLTSLVYKYAPTALSKAQELSSAIPVSSIAFIIGFVVGILRG
ncbi:MAG: hypothetical protein ACP5UI_03625 [Thermoprotei archaeon]|nr:hypothetical protein [TACK group archaeon]